VRIQQSLMERSSEKCVSATVVAVVVCGQITSRLLIVGGIMSTNSAPLHNVMRDIVVQAIETV
jgi:hypothetical protein